jgi:cytochrome c peroxidase
LPNAVGIGADGEGAERLLKHDGEIIPRNTLPLWGRGDPDFRTFFWDGRVSATEEGLSSQFGDRIPSENPIIVAVHLPVLEIREMLSEDQLVSQQKTESVDSANRIYKEIARSFVKAEPAVSEALALELEKKTEDLTFLDLATAVAEFIDVEFQLKSTKFHEFVFSDGELDENEKLGARLFYGKGKCAACHSGRHFSDFSFHAIPTPQIGFGRNGFGVDYGRFNVTHNPDDLYKFRTPPLSNVSKTAPYSHSGSIASLEEMVILHFDPLRTNRFDEWSVKDRVEFVKKMASVDSELIPSLSDSEVDALVAFLETLEF